MTTNGPENNSVAARVGYRSRYAVKQRIRILIEKRLSELQVPVYAIFRKVVKPKAGALDAI